MNYKSTLDWMFSKLPMYQRKGKSALKKDLTNIIAFCKVLDNPEVAFPSVHVAGTNGKGSTSHMIASVLQQAGYRVGLYTSPHLKDFRERIRINGACIIKKEVVDFILRNRDFLEEQKLSFFEMTVGMAFDYFAIKKVDIAVVEVGLGGRLDSTNILKPLVSVITNIGLDHTQFLGETLSEIAVEKAGIIKENVPVVIGERHEKTENIFNQIAKQKNAEIFFAEDLRFPTYKTDLLGEYQKKNLRTATATFFVLNKISRFKISEESIAIGLKNVVKNTNLKGRWQILGKHPKIVCDTAHNKEGLHLVISQLLKEKFNKLHIVLGVVDDKKLNQILPLFPKKAMYYFCKPDIPRGKRASELREQAVKFGLLGKSYASVFDAYKSAKNIAQPVDLIFVGGSTFVVAEIPLG